MAGLWPVSGRFAAPGVATLIWGPGAEVLGTGGLGVATLIWNVRRSIYLSSACSCLCMLRGIALTGNCSYPLSGLLGCSRGGDLLTNDVDADADNAAGNGGDGVGGDGGDDHNDGGVYNF